MSKEGHRDEKTLRELQDEHYRLITKLEYLTRREDVKLEEINRRHGTNYVDINAYLLELETFWINVSLHCPSKLELISILQCTERLKSRDCIKKDCLFRLILLASLF